MMKTRILLLLMTVLVWTACDNNPCDGVDCLNGGICMDGTCDCPDGFIGRIVGVVLDPCEQQNCDPFRTDSCVALNFAEARCDCKNGFEGDRCEDRWEDKFVGAYTAAENCNGDNELFLMEIEVGPDPQTITLERFHNQSGAATRVVGKLLNGLVFDIETQFMAFGVVSGAGSINQDGIVSINYQIITNNSDTLLCSAALQPQ